MGAISRWQDVLGEQPMVCQQVQHAIQHSFVSHIPDSQRALIETGQPIYIACSGGRDSVALLYGCWRLGLPIHVIHINHQLQPISDSWQRQVEDFCQRLDVAYTSVRLDWDVSVKTVSEQMARVARYQAIGGVAGENALIALAHHADDQAETVLMNLCQGTGLAGLAGMRALSQQAEFDTLLWLWRPLLSIPRETISELVTACALPYVDDPTNIGEHNQRAFLRQHILPKLQQRFHGLSQNIHRTTQNVQEAQQMLTVYREQHITQLTPVATWTPYQQVLDIHDLNCLSREARFLLLHHWVKGKEKFAPKRQLIEQIEALIQQPASDYTAILTWQGYQIRRYRHALYRLTTGYVKLLAAMTTLSTDTLIKWQDGLPLTLLQAENYRLQIIPAVALANHPTLLKEKWRLRPVKAGEKFKLTAKAHHQSLKKICQAYAITPWERHIAWVLELTTRKSDTITVALILPNHCLPMQGITADSIQFQDNSFCHDNNVYQWLSQLSLQIVGIVSG